MSAAPGLARDRATTAARRVGAEVGAESAQTRAPFAGYRRPRGRRVGSPPFGWGCAAWLRKTSHRIQLRTARRCGVGMRVYQAGSHLLEERGVRVRDWSWRQTRRRFSTLNGWSRRTAGARSSRSSRCSLATVIALAPPFLAKLRARRRDATAAADLYLVVALFLVAGLANWGMTYAQTYLTGWVGERMLADLRTRLFDHLQRLSLGFYERNRAGVIISRLTNDVEALDQLVTDGVSSLVQSTLTLVGTAILLFILDWRLALATLRVIPVMSVGDGPLPRATRRARTAPSASASGSSPRRSPRTSPACASSRRSRASRSTSATSARSASATGSRTSRRSS